MGDTSNISWSKIFKRNSWLLLKFNKFYSADFKVTRYKRVGLFDLFITSTMEFMDC